MERRDLPTHKEVEAAILAWTHELAPHGILTTDNDLRITSWNHWLQSHSGLRAEDVLGRPITDVFPVLTERRLDIFFQNALKGQNAMLASALHRWLLPLRPAVSGTGFTEMQQSARIAPLLKGGAICGTITVIEDVTEREWQSTELRRDRERVEILSDILGQLLAARSADTLMRPLFDKIAPHLKLDAFFYYVPDKSGSRLYLQSAGGLSLDAEDRCRALPSGTDICGTNIERRSLVLLQRIQHTNDPRSGMLRQFGFKAYAAFPLVVSDYSLGLLGFASRSVDSFEEADIDFLHTVSRYLASTLNRARQESALRESEQRFRIMAETVPDIIFTTTPGGRCDYLNQHFYAITGMEPSTALDFGWMQAVHPHDLQTVQEQWRHSVRTGEPFSLEYRLRTPDGSYRWFASRAHPLLADPDSPESPVGQASRLSPPHGVPASAGARSGGASYTSPPAPSPAPSSSAAPHSSLGILKWLGAMADVHDLKQTQLALAQAQANLTEHSRNLEKAVADRTAKLRDNIVHLESFSYTVAHDLRAPIRAMEGYAQILLDDFGDQLPPMAKAIVGNIGQAARRLDALTRDVLNYTKVSTQEIELVPVDLSEVLQDVLMMNTALKPPRAHITAIEPLGAVVGHPTLLAQCLANLLDNATKFVELGVTPVVTIRTERVPGTAARGSALAPQPPSPQQWIRIYIEDNGIGMEPSAQARIFGIFERARGMSAYPGTGVGLAIVAKAVEKMNGAYGVYSQQDVGSRFWIELPEATDTPDAPQS